MASVILHEHLSNMVHRSTLLPFSKRLVMAAVPQVARRTNPQLRLGLPVYNQSRAFFFSPIRKTGSTDAFVPAAPITDVQVRALFHLWNSSLATLDSRIVAKRYSKDPILLPTVSDIARTDFESIKDYYDLFLQLKPQGEILESKIQIGHNWANDAGIYEFTMGANGDKVKARYSFVYIFEDGQWKITHHHSSRMPEQKGRSITPEHAQNLFYLWNDALDTLDSTAVAKRYAKQATLIPAVSETPFSDFASIKEYFDNFLKLKPQAKVLESYVMVDDGWCHDVGIYQLTMRATGTVVKARFSFIYVFEDREWKIVHHHSSAMPES